MVYLYNIGIAHPNYMLADLTLVAANDNPETGIFY